MSVSVASGMQLADEVSTEELIEVRVTVSPSVAHSPFFYLHSFWQVYGVQLTIAQICNGFQFTDASPQILMFHLKERNVDVGH